MAQIITQNSGGGGGGSGSGDMLKAMYDPQNIEKDAFDYENFTNTPTIPVVPTEVSAFDNDAGYITENDLPDLSGYQTKANMVTSLTGADNDHYPTAKCVSDAITSAGGGDMLKATYDPNNIGKDAFDYDNFINTPTIPAAQVNSDWDAVSGVAKILNKPTIPTVNNSTIEIQKNGTKVKDFTLNQSSGETINITVPTNTSDLNNDSGFTTNTGDVVGPASSTDGDLALFDGATGKLLKDGAKKISDLVQTSGNQTIAGTKTFSTSPVVPSKTTAATNSGTAIATEAQVKLVADDVSTINGKISSAATSSNKLVDKNYVDDSINSVTAYYITKNAQGDQFATYAELSSATTFYSGGVARTPTRNDYCIVASDENHDNATTRYIYNSGWEYQYTVNETALTTAQINALNSGITSGKVSTYDGYATTISGKQDALTLPTTPTQGNLVVRGANNKTIADGGAIPTGYNPGNTGNTGQVLTKTAGGYEYADAPVTSVNGQTGAVTVSGGHDYSWKTKTGASFKIDLRSYIEPSQNFTVNLPDELEDGMEYVLRCVNGATAYTMTLGTGFTNPRNVSLSLNSYASDQFVFVAINGELELQPEPQLK